MGDFGDVIREVATYPEMVHLPAYELSQLLELASKMDRCEVIMTRIQDEVSLIIKNEVQRQAALKKVCGP